MSIESQIPVPAYIKSSREFISHRLTYSANSNPLDISNIENRVFRDILSPEQKLQRGEVLANLNRQKSNVIVITATIDRPKEIALAYRVLESQTITNWQWLIVDNGREEATHKLVEDFKDNRISYVNFLEDGGCAYPVRNIGLDIVYLAKRNSINQPFILVVDSDDRLYDEHSLYELLKIANAESHKKDDIVLVHGYSATEIHEQSGLVTHVPNPRNFGSDFPSIKALKEVFDKGLNILSGMFPARLLSFLRYPHEFSFEDDGFNQKLLLQAKKMGCVWVCDNVPTTIKTFHQDSMSERNNQIGDMNESGSIGLHKVTGIRARIVQYLHDITDYYSQQEL